MDKDSKLAPPPARPAGAWTRPQDYWASLARRRTARRRHEPEALRTEPDEPRLSLSTLPFLALLIAMAVLAAGIIVAAWPGREKPQAQPEAEERERGTAPPGWLERSQRDRN